MKYLTKKWYKTMQKTYMYLPLKVSKKAENFSEEYYNELYKQEERRYIKLQKETKKLLIKTNENDTFDLVQAKKEFKQLHKNNIKNLKYKLPTKILNKVADIRVLALYRASTSIKKEITDYCIKQEILVQKALKDYQKYYDEELKDHKGRDIQNFNLHDALIRNIIKEKDKLVLELELSEGNENIKNITFQDYKIIEEELNFINGWCLYKEIYSVENEYELHRLVDVPTRKEGVKLKDSKLGYFTIMARDIIID